MVAISELHNDDEFFDTQFESSDELDLSFLEAVESAENLFGINTSFFETLKMLKPKRELVPSLHTTVFEKPVEHAVWSRNWPSSNRHFPA